jgi:hypothetical protein
MQYMVVTNKGDDNDEVIKEFTKKVNELLNQGWELAGGISSHSRGNWHYYTQALIKK